VTKTFCDRCGGECVHWVLNLTGYVAHTTRGGEVAGEDEVKPRQLCKTCGEPAIALLGLVLRPAEGVPVDVAIAAEQQRQASERLLAEGLPG
jgi:hypothetical protein